MLTTFEGKKGFKATSCLSELVSLMLVHQIEFDILFS